MKHVPTIVALLLALPFCAFSQTTDQNKARQAKADKELRESVRLWDNATVRGDATTLDRLLADEFGFVGGPAKAQYLASIRHRSPDSIVTSAVSSDLEVQVYGNMAIVSGLDTIAGKNKGEPYISKWLYMDVWIKRDGRWQCVKTYSTLSNK